MSKISSIFGTYAENLQALVDTRLDKFSATFYNKYFDLGLPQPGLTYATAIGRARIEAAASVVAHGAAAPLRSRPALERLSGEVAAIKVKRTLDEADYRNYLTVQNMSISEESKRLQMLKLLWDDVKYVGDAVMKRIDIMAAQALSTGYVTINTTTNPDGVIPGAIDLLVTYNQHMNGAAVGASNSNRYWTTALYATATPITDITKVVEYGRARGIVYEKILVHRSKLLAILAATETVNVLKAFKLVEAGTVIPNLGMLNEFMVANDLPVIESVEVYGYVEKDGVLTSITAWDTANVTFVPAGRQGTIFNSIAIEEISPVANVAYAKFNNALISKWSQTEPFGEYTRGEISAFPGLETADSIFILDTEANS